MSNEDVVETTLRFIIEASALGITGFNIYQQNRLIRPFWKVTGDGNSKGYGIVGVLEANFIEPEHYKQDFERRRHCHFIGHQPDKQFLCEMQKTSIEPLLIEDEPLDQTFSGHVTNLRLDLSGSHTGSRDRTVFKNDRPIVQAPPGFDTVFRDFYLISLT
ncbi:microrchidia 2-like protein [Tanacetum coccineum]